MSEAARFAVYAAPPQHSPLAEFGAAVLGYDAQSGRDVAQLAPPGFEPDDWRGLTEEPRRYGFHGTLKAPFRLAAGKTPHDLESMTAGFAQFRTAQQIPLVLERIGAFFALVPEGRPPRLHALADDIVQAFAAFRAPLSAQDRERRLKANLSPRHIELMDAHGYPYVMETFRFHMTLTGRVPQERAEAVHQGLQHLVRSALGGQPVALALDDLCIFEQTDPAARFRVRSRFPLAG